MEAGLGSGETRITRILLAASTTSVRRLLIEDLDGAEFVVCAVEESAERAIEAALAHEPDVLLLANDLPGSGVAAVETIAEAAPRTKVIVVAESVDEDDCLTYLLAGASGYVARETRGAALTSAVRGVVAGLAIVPATAQRRLLQELRT